MARSKKISLGTLSRRAVLRATPALSGLALGSCQSQKNTQPKPPTARWVGQDPVRGHILRSARPDTTLPVSRRAQVIVVGGGASGHAALWWLARNGITDVIQIELEDAIAGTARSGSTERSAYPMGAHYLPVPNPECTELEAMLEDLGILVGRDTHGRAIYQASSLCPAPLERHHYRGTWHSGLYPAHGQTAAEADQFARWNEHLRVLDAARDMDGRRSFRLPLRTSANGMRNLDRISMAQYMDNKGFTSWRLRWFVDYACRDDYGCRLSETSAFAALHHFLCRGHEDGRDGLILTWPEGNAHIIDRLAAYTNLPPARRLLGHAVIGVEAPSGTLSVLNLGSLRQSRIQADSILWAAPRFVLRALLRDEDQLQQDALSYSPWLVTNLELDARPSGFGAPPSWDNVPIDGDNLGYVVATHNQSRDELDPRCVLSFYEPQLGDPASQRRRMIRSTLSETTQSVITQLEAMHPGIRRHLRRVDIARWGHGMVRPIPGLLFGSTLRTAGQALGKVLPCASDTAGIALFEEAFYAGVRGAKRAITRMSAL